MRRRLGWLVLTFVIAIPNLPRTAWALTRDQVFSNVRDYIEVGYVLDARNGYIGPCANGVHCNCYLNSTNHGPQLPAGSWTGLVYAYGFDESWESIFLGLLTGKGAGVTRQFWNLNGGQYRSCLVDSCTGIDCSAFASRAWSIARLGTCGLIASGVSKQILDPSAVKPADAFVKCGSHVALFKSPVSVDGAFTSWEATGNDNWNRCAEIAYPPFSYDDFIDRGYRPYVSKRLKDDPAASLLSFEASDRGSMGVWVEWVTLMEDRSATFVVCRADSPQGPFQAISGEIPTQGSPTQGASYEFTDASPLPGDSYYRLRETETSGRTIWHRITPGVGAASGASP